MSQLIFPRIKAYYNNLLFFRGGGKGLPGKIQSLMLKYISAFANHEGGHIYFGIDDVRASVIGEDLNESEQRRTGMYFFLI